MNVTICGLGGLGRALAAYYLQRGCQVYTISRSSAHAAQIDSHFTYDLVANSQPLQLDDFLMHAQPEIIINTIGVLHDQFLFPEKTLMQQTAEQLQRSMNINVLPALHLAQALQRISGRQQILKLLCCSARVASISDNRLGGWHSYRMSKAALNMLIKNIAIEWRQRLPHAIIAGYHPGTVDTRLSKPFQKNLKHELFTPERAATYCAEVVEQLGKHDSGNIIDWQNTVIAP